MKIHPTAIIHPDAEIADGVEIGPYVCIEGKAIIDVGCIVQAHAVLTGDVHIGKNNLIGYGVIIGAPPQDLAFKSSTRSDVRIGDNNQIREYCTIHRGTTEGSTTRVGDNNFLMAGVHLAHNVHVMNRVTIANNALMGGYVEIQDGAFVGGGSGFHQHIRVGQLAIIQGNSGFSKDVPPFTIAAEINYIVGLNIIGLRRAGLKPDQRQEIKTAFNLLYKSGFNTAQALERAEKQPWKDEGRAFFDFVRSAKKRGICGLMETRKSSSMGKSEI